MATATAFTPQTFAKLSPHPFHLASLQQSHHPQAQAQPNSNNASSTPTRANGRAPHESRPISINTSSLSHAHGSSMVRIGDTSVICGVRGEILPATSIPQWRKPLNPAADVSSAEEVKEEGAREMRDYDLLVPNIELATGCSPSHLPGAPPSTLAQTLSTRVYSLLHTARVLDAEDLRIWYTPEEASAGVNGGDDAMRDVEGEGEELQLEPELRAYWTLYIDVLFVSLDGNAFDAAWAAVLAALRDTKLPKAWWDADREMVLCSRAKTNALRTSGLPVACTASVLTDREKDVEHDGTFAVMLVDPDREEEKLCDEYLTAVVDRSEGQTGLRGISKFGGRTQGSAEIRQLVTVAEKRWEEIAKVLSQ
ncbi:ribosomal protein S5 domain 2-type protein [Coniella lustricola]|uniref:Ribosomal RNA-processing protein 43 n=1 Tax=Coniella lustricola TaxID=2025994 RepID=A0A2T3A6K7_9PEZI|nr:ribosomal protein S5 domain 2-type protein [Coniella lustricola]